MSKIRIKRIPPYKISEELASLENKLTDLENNLRDEIVHSNNNLIGNKPITRKNDVRVETVKTNITMILQRYDIKLKELINEIDSYVDETSLKYLGLETRLYKELITKANKIAETDFTFQFGTSTWGSKIGKSKELEQILNKWDQKYKATPIYKIELLKSDLGSINNQISLTEKNIRKMGKDIDSLIKRSNLLTELLNKSNEIDKYMDIQGSLNSEILEIKEQNKRQNENIRQEYGNKLHSLTSQSQLIEKQYKSNQTKLSLIIYDILLKKEFLSHSTFLNRKRRELELQDLITIKQSITSVDEDNKRIFKELSSEVESIKNEIKTNVRKNYDEILPEITKKEHEIEQINVRIKNLIKEKSEIQNKMDKTHYSDEVLDIISNFKRLNESTKYYMKELNFLNEEVNKYNDDIIRANKNRNELYNQYNIVVSEINSLIG